jgi:predicted RNA-binding Zn-ribbon protein involved in translation (DUF1610 family)
MAKNYCSNCGAKVDQTTNYCPSCGKSFDQTVRQRYLDVSEKSRKKASTTNGILILLPFVIFAVAIFYGSKKNNEDRERREQRNEINKKTEINESQVKTHTNNINLSVDTYIAEQNSQSNKSKQIDSLKYDGINLFNYNRQKGFEVYVSTDIIMDGTYTRIKDSSQFIRRNLEFFDSVIISPKFNSMKFYKKEGPLSNDWDYIYDKIYSLIGKEETLIRDEIPDYNDKNLSNTIWQGRASLGRTWHVENYLLALDYHYWGIELWSSLWRDL